MHLVDSCCVQILWLKQQLEDYGIKVNHIPIKCDNSNGINMSKNPIHHLRTKHIKIRRHFIKDHIQKGDIVLEYVPTKIQLVDIFAKSLERNQLTKIINELGAIEI